MRIPLLIVIPLCLVTLLGAWFAGTRDKDFTTPPTQNHLNNVAKQWRAEQPESKSQPNEQEAPTPPILVEKKEVTYKVPEPLLPTGDLTKSPSLSEYGIYNEKGSTELIRLAAHLTEQKSPQRALLAWERVLDMTQPNNQQREQAIAAITQLKTKLSPWNIDPLGEIKLLLKVDSQVKNPAALKESMIAVAGLINQVSDFIIKIDVQIKNSTPQGDKAAMVNIQFSQADDTPEGIPSFALPYFANKPDDFKKLVEASIYQLMRQQLITNTSFTPLPELSTNDTPELALTHNITRLMWREFGRSMR